MRDIPLMGAGDDKREISQTFGATLLGDVVAAEARLAEADSDANRRDVIRTGYAAIEGVVWIMREHTHAALQEMGYLTPLADLALRERSYSSPTRARSGNRFCSPRFVRPSA